MAAGVAIFDLDVLLAAAVGFLALSTDAASSCFAAADGFGVGLGVAAAFFCLY